MKTATTTLAFLISTCPVGTHAARIPLGTNPTIGGMQVSCMGVPAWLDSEISDIAIAVPGAIVLNPVLQKWPRVVQVFVYAHECAHQQANVGSDENGADCWAIKLGRNQRWFDLRGLQTIQAYFYRNQGDWTHLPGPYRIEQMAACFRFP